MSKNKKADQRGFVYSTDPDFSFDPETPTDEETLPPSRQRLRILLDTKQRAGKAVTLITGFIGKQDDLEQLGKQLKNHCGAGGSVKDKEILVQGDHRPKVQQFLQKLGYKTY